jgi:hypothetical protein
LKHTTFPDNELVATVEIVPTLQAFSVPVGIGCDSRISNVPGGPAATKPPLNATSPGEHVASDIRVPVPVTAVAPIV